MALLPHKLAQITDAGCPAGSATFYIFNGGCYEKVLVFSRDSGFDGRNGL